MRGFVGVRRGRSLRVSLRASLRGALLALALCAVQYGVLAPQARAQGTPVSLAALDNVTAAYTDGQSFSANGGIDGLGSAYSATLLGSSLSVNGTVLQLGAANQPNAITGQTISVEAGKYASLVLLGTAVNGSQTSQTFVVTYTDGTRTTYTQSLSDWFASSGFPNETIAKSMSYRNASNGTKDNRTFNLYAYSFTLDATRTVRNVTLPGNRNVVVLALSFGSAMPISLAGTFNRAGAFNDGATFSSTSGLDGHGKAYSATLLGTSRTINGVPYLLGPANGSNVISATSQTIALPAVKAATVNVLAAAVNGSQMSQPFLVTYTDGTVTNIIQSLSDWIAPSNFGNETKAVTMTYRNTNTGGRDTRAVYLYGYSFALDASRVVRSIRVPNNPNVEVAAITLGAAGSNTTGIIGDCGIKSKGSGTGQVDYVLVYQSSLAKWCVDASLWSANAGAISQFFFFGDAVVSQLNALFQIVPANLPFVYQVADAGIHTGSDFGLGVTIVYDAFFNVLTDPEVVPGFWGYVLPLHEAINDYTGLVAPGWPQDWWADHRSPFPNSMDYRILQQLGLQENNPNLQLAGLAQHERFAVQGKAEYDPEVVMFDGFYDQFGGFTGYENAFNLIRGDGLNWDLVGTNVTPLRSSYVIAYLQLGFGTAADSDGLGLHRGRGRVVWPSVPGQRRHAARRLFGRPERGPRRRQRALLDQRGAERGARRQHTAGQPADRQLPGSHRVGRHPGQLPGRVRLERRHQQVRRPLVTV